MALIDLEGLAPGELEQADTLVVGAGAVGLVVAVSLARRGQRVLLVEAGPRQLAASSQAVFEEARSVGPQEHDGLHHGRFRALGGTTNFWGGQLVAFEPHIFGSRPWVAEGMEWPIGLEDLEPFYEEALTLLGLGAVIRSDEEVLRRLRQAPPELGKDLEFFFTRWVPQPNLAAYFDEDLTRRPELTCLVNAQAAALIAEDGRVGGVEVVDSRGRRHALAAKRVVLANGTVEIARLLMLPLANGQAAPWSSNPRLGRGFIDHLKLVIGELTVLDRRRFNDLFENVVVDGHKYQPKLRLGAGAQARDEMVDLAAELSFNASHAAHLANAKIFVRGLLRGQWDRNWRSYPRTLLGLVRFGLPMVVRYLRDNRIHSGGGPIDVSVVSEQIPIPASRLLLTGKRDRLGVPIAELDWQIDGRELRSIAAFSREVAHRLEAAGLAKLKLDPAVAEGGPAMLSRIGDHYHQMGMARMANSAERGVVDRNGKVFGSENLFVAGAATFPSSGHPNPTFTGMALGLRLARGIAEGRL